LQDVCYGSYGFEPSISHFSGFTSAYNITHKFCYFSLSAQPRQRGRCLHFDCSFFSFSILSQLLQPVCKLFVFQTTLFVLTILRDFYAMFYCFV
jgi:hypothetical protein